MTANVRIGIKDRTQRTLALRDRQAEPRRIVIGPEAEHIQGGK